MLPDSITLNKGAIIERCIQRMREEYAADPELENYTHMDALILNIERACQATIDLAMHQVAQSHLGIPQSSADAFVLLQKAGTISHELALRMSNMVGFRNIAIHQYQDLETEVIHFIMQHGIQDIIAFATTMHLRIADCRLQTTD